MKCALLSDVHDHVWNLRAILHAAAPATGTLLFCGDLCAPFMIGHLGDSYPNPIHLVFGNNDGDTARIAGNAAKIPHLTVHHEYADLELAGRRIAVNHYPAIAESIAAAGRHHLVAYGHDHRAAVRTSAGRLLVNPGAVMGYDGVARTEVPASFAVYDTDTGSVTFHRLVHPASPGTPLPPIEDWIP